MFPGYRSHRNELSFDAIKDYQDGRRLKDFIDNKVDDVIVVIEKKFKISFKDKLCDAIVVIERKFGIVLVTITIFVASFLGPIESESLSPTISFSSKIDSPLEIVINDEAKILSDDLKINQIFKSHSPIMDYILDLKGGGLEKDDDVEKTDKLIKSIVSKSPQSSSSEISINKVLKKMLDIAEPIVTNQKVWKLAEVATNPVKPEFSGSPDLSPRNVLSPSSKRSSTIFAESLTPSHIYCNHYHNDGSKLSCGQAKSLPDDLKTFFPMDKEGYFIGKGGKKFVRVQHEHKIATFETPKNPNDPVQDASEVIGTKKISLTTDIRKRQLSEKSKHKKLFTNPDGSPVLTDLEFRDSQVKFLKEKSETKYVSDCILLGENSEPRDCLCVFEDINRMCMVLEKVQRWNPITKSMEESKSLEYVGPRQLNKNRYIRYKRYGIVGNDGKDISQARHGMKAKELMEIRSNQIAPFDDSGQCFPNEKK